VIGLGRIGAPLAACLAARGLDVVGVDVDRSKVEAVNAGEPPVREPGLAQLMGESLRATLSVADAVRGTDVTFVTVPTPAEPDGSLSSRHVEEACAAVGAALRHKRAFHVVAVTSTLMPGSGARLARMVAAASGKRPGEGFVLCYVPEFVALGTAIRDFLRPDVILVGEPDPGGGESLEALLRGVCENEPVVVRTTWASAELAKLALNAFLATKVTFANVLAQVCEGLPGADVDAVTAVLGADRRIGRAYLTGAMSFGGPCLPRDTAALAAVARDAGAPPGLADAALDINAVLLDRLVARVLRALPAGGRVGICGLAFKPGTDAVDDSPPAMLAARLAAAGVRVVAFDPMVTRAEGIEVVPSVERCIAAADVIVLATPDERWTAAQLEGRTVIDCWRTLEQDDGLRLAA
jgi:UDPglucose 6-dehydrogenase